jgi:hypothetical protein
LFLFAFAFAQNNKTVAQDTKQNEANAIATVRTLNTAVYTYSSTYPDGYPPTLFSLSDRGRDYSPEHAGLISAELGCEAPPCAMRGYYFTYTRIVVGDEANDQIFVVTARPRRYGVTGKLSLYSDQNAVIRGTFENRPATAADKPVQELIEKREEAGK